MSRLLWIFIALAALAMVVASLWQRVPQTFRPLTKTENQPLITSEVIGVETRSFNDAGVLAYDFTADKMTYFQINPEQAGEGDYTHITAPFFTIYQTPETPWFLRAREGRTEGREEALHLQHDVRAWQENAANEVREIHSEALTIHPQAQIAETDKPVMIRFPWGEFTAGAMTANLKTEEFILRDNVEGIYEPAP